MQAISTVREANKIATRLGLVRGKGLYNGEVFWLRPGSSAIVTRARLAEMAGLA